MSGCCKLIVHCSLVAAINPCLPTCHRTDCTGFLNFVDWSTNDAHPMSFGASDTTLSNVLTMRNQDCGGLKAIQAAESTFVTWTHFGQRDEVRGAATL